MTSNRRGAATWFRRRRAALTVIIPLALVALVAAGFSAANPGPGTCNRNLAGAASVEFQVSNVVELRTRIPMFGQAPELDAAKGPFSLVVFEGPHEAVPIYPALMGSGESMVIPEPDKIVCVVEPNGIENYYGDVDLNGLNLDGLSVDRVSD
jgi:hypothetical protein